MQKSLDTNNKFLLILH